MSEMTAVLEPAVESSATRRDHQPDRVITLPNGLVGLPDLKRWVLMEMDPPLPLRWLTSLDREGFRVPVASPDLFTESYGFELPDEARRLFGGTSGLDLAVMIISTIHPGGEKITGNLAAPLIVETGTRIGLQSILDDRNLSMRKDLDRDRFRVLMNRIKRSQREGSRTAALLGQVELARSARKGDDLLVKI